MADENYPQDPGVTTGTPNKEAKSDVTMPQFLGVFPDAQQQTRINEYDYFERLFMGHHWEAFNIKIDDADFSKAYSKLKYIMVNFPGFISKICADLLFSEPPTFKAEDGDQDFLDALIEANHLHIQNYESALSNSYNGDALYKLRIGLRNPGDKFSTVIIEDVSPSIYFPKINPWNVKAAPEYEDLAWTFEIGIGAEKKKYLRIERHYPGRIENLVYLMEGNKIVGLADISLIGIKDLPPVVYTGVSRSLLFHIPNWKTGNRYFGISDYQDLQQLFFSVNNRMSKVDAILDKHSDPILLLPDGVLDANGKVKKSQIGVIEIKEGETNKPEYVVWDASLENAFKEIEKAVEFIMMIGEISPDVVGMGKGQSDSGRALKMKIMRTLAKVARKKGYYDMNLKDLLFLSQELAKAWNVGVGPDNHKLSTKPVRPQIKWYDGLPIDESEQVDTEVKRVDAGLSTVKDSLVRIDGMDEDEAEEKATEIEEERKMKAPDMGFGEDLLGKTKVIPKPKAPMPAKE